MKKLYYFKVILLVALTFDIQAQNRSVSGIITDGKGDAASFANILVIQTGVGVTANAKGEFTIEGLEPNTYTLRITRVGSKTLKKDIVVVQGSISDLQIALQEAEKQLEVVTVTATRTLRNVEDVPMPVNVIQGENIEKIGALRLNEVLAEQVGLQITSDHGTGLQMQGLNSEYILILIDGEPVIGRTAGTLDLTRIAVDNISRVEVIRGPSSSLYGSEAMAGVINIITKEGLNGFDGSLRARYRSFNTANLSGNMSYRGEKISASLFVDRLSSDGYDLTEESISMTSPPYKAYTLSPKIGYRFSEKVKLNLNTRFYTETQESEQALTLDEETVQMDDKGKREDWNIMPTLEIKPDNNHRLQLRSYTTGYKTETSLTYHNDGSVYSESYFDQLFNRSEIQYDWYINDRNILTTGLGHTIETVEATRYEDVNNFNANYGFAQYQFIPSDRFNLVIGGRYDTHSEYASRFSPKLAVGYQVSNWMRLQASLGGGYKAPDFRQLLLNFTNPTAGYSVVGSSIAKEQMAEFVNAGQIAQILIDPNTIETIEAESSIAYNFGIDFTPTKKLTVTVNAFRNEISNLINTAPIARKTNGQNIFSYFNEDEVVTQGLDAQLNYKPKANLILSVGYQYLDSRNVEDVERIKNGEVFRRDPNTNRTVVVNLSEYGGLVNRSRHSGNAKIFYINSRYKFDVALRGIYRGEWGLGDSNGNGIVDVDNELAEGYFLLNLAINKKLYKGLTLEVGVNNLLDKTHEFEPSLPGRILFGGININLSEFKNL
ncbi:MAG: TonB-dependent receptor [Bacteroidota bacterium]